MSSKPASYHLGQWLFEDEASVVGYMFSEGGEGLMFAAEKGGSAVGNRIAYTVTPESVAVVAWWSSTGPRTDIVPPLKLRYRQESDDLVIGEGGECAVLSRRAWPGNGV